MMSPEPELHWTLPELWPVSLSPDTYSLLGHLVMNVVVGDGDGKLS